MASRIQAKSSAGGPAADVPRALPAAALTGPWPVAAREAVGRCEVPGVGALFFAAGSGEFAGAATSGGFSMVREGGTAGDSAWTDVPRCLSGPAAANAGGTGRRSIRA